MPTGKLTFLIIILFCGSQLPSFSKTIQSETLKVRQTKDKEISLEKACDFTEYKPRKFSDFPDPNQVIEKVSPEYPELARKARIKGTVMVKILVDRGGNVIRACVIKGHPLLGSAAVNAALKWKFKQWCPSCPQETTAESAIVFRFNADRSTTGIDRQKKKLS